MINVAAIRMQQFGVQFYQASLTAGDIDKLVRLEVLNYGDGSQSGVRGSKARAGGTPSKVNWDLLERRIASSEKAYQRQIIRRTILRPGAVHCVLKHSFADGRRILDTRFGRQQSQHTFASSLGTLHLHQYVRD